MQRLLLFLLFFLVSPALFVPPAVVGKTARPAVAVAPKKTVKQKQPAAKAKTITKSTVRVKAAPAKKTAPKPAAPKAVVAKKITSAKSAPRKKVPAKTSRQKVVGKKRAQPKQAARSQARALPVVVPAERCGNQPDIATQISARSVMVMDATSGETIFAKMADNPRQPASTIKIVTAMIALESLKNSDQVEASRYAANMPSSKIFIEPGNVYLADDLISAVLLASANDASVALAEKIAGSEEKFAHLMTLSAKMWGAKNTVCRTASGLTAVGQQSTARDLANLFRFAMQHEPFAARVREKYISTSYGKKLRNHNRALWRIDGAVGGKTGYTVAARQTYVGQFSRDGQSIVVAIMGSESMWADLAKLVEYGFKSKHTPQTAQANT
ncbi:MAG: D-alanyl-D-alanine carboxypeptidase [Desulfobulbus sp.]|nr:D-alanyl-D-alanine carboxypeptidase [Desulfobulbus sp.]